MRLSINRNILECKDIGEYREIIVKTVLIETYWNVKVDLSIAKQYEVMY